MPQMYSTLTSNDSRVSDKDTEIGADFDVYCGESNSQLNISTTSVKSSSYTDPKLDVDPEPTDYSQRYKERPIDDFIVLRSNKPEVAGYEDSVKVYKTEGTPLNFSLASSLSDLRDVCLSSIDEEKQSKQEKCISFQTNEMKDKPKVVFKKPILPPKPKLSAPVVKPIIDAKQQPETKCVTFDEKQIKSSVSTNSIVSIDVSNENLCEKTPLMYSRNSSLGSFSDCEVKSDVCQSSVVSEFSRRQSEVVTPSDLPDSPLDSPRPSSPKQSSTSKQAVKVCHKITEELVDSRVETNFKRQQKVMYLKTNRLLLPLKTRPQSSHCPRV